MDIKENKQDTLGISAGIGFFSVSTVVKVLKSQESSGLGSCGFL